MGQLPRLPRLPRVKTHTTWAVKKGEELPIMPPKLDEDVALRLALMATELQEVSEWQGLPVQLSDFVLTQGQPAMLQATPQFRDLLVPTPASLPWTQRVRQVSAPPAWPCNS
jgi:hypothetical protein